MMRRFDSATGYCMLLASVLLASGMSSGAASNREVSKLYSDNCSICHGENLQGGLGRNFLKDEFKYGSDDASLQRSIEEGYPDNGMPGWKKDLSPQEIRALIVFIREKREQAQRKANQDPRPVEGQVVSSREHKFKLTTVVEGLDTPWSFAFLPNGNLLVTELRGTLRLLEKGKLLPEPIIGTPTVRHEGQGGLLEVALHPGYASNGWVYLSFSDKGGDSAANNGMTEVVRGRIRENHWTDQQVIFKAAPEQYKPGGIHFGSRLVFDESGHLFFTIGERGAMHDAQDLSRPNGKVHRIFDDGRIPPDNPFVGSSNAVPSIWSFGHRNPQGLARHPVTGEIWEAEHGPRGGDELNWIQKGLNYGWPVITYGMDYNGTAISALTAKEGLEQPIVYWTPSIAVCAINFYTGEKFSKWKNNLLVTALAQQELRRLVIQDHKVLSQEVLFKNIGRVRYVKTGPDGFIYAALNGPDKIIRLEPADDSQ